MKSLATAFTCRFVRLNAVFKELPVAVTTKLPVMPLAVNAGADATPCESVVTVVLPAKLPLAPLPGAVNVTVIPPTPLPPASVTVACSDRGNWVLINVRSHEPLVAVMDIGGPGVAKVVKDQTDDATVPPWFRAATFQ